MIKFECETDGKGSDGKAIIKGFAKVDGKPEDIRTELRIVFRVLEDAVGEDIYTKALNDWLTFDKRFKG